MFARRLSSPGTFLFRHFLSKKLFEFSESLKRFFQKCKVPKRNKEVSAKSRIRILTVHAAWACVKWYNLYYIPPETHIIWVIWQTRFWKCGAVHPDTDSWGSQWLFDMKFEFRDWTELNSESIFMHYESCLENVPLLENIYLHLSFSYFLEIFSSNIFSI